MLLCACATEETSRSHHHRAGYGGGGDAFVYAGDDTYDGGSDNDDTGDSRDGNGGFIASLGWGRGRDAEYSAYDEIDKVLLKSTFFRKKMSLTRCGVVVVPSHHITHRRRHPLHHICIDRSTMDHTRRRSMTDGVRRNDSAGVWMGGVRPDAMVMMMMMMMARSEE